MASAALAVADGELQTRAPATGPRELARLGGDVNQMAESLLDASRRRELEAECERALAQLQESEEALREQARRDPLTGVLNHGAIADELRSLLAEGGGAPHAVAMVDVDGLKAVNDTPLAIRSATLSSWPSRKRCRRTVLTLAGTAAMSSSPSFGARTGQRRNAVATQCSMSWPVSASAIRRPAPVCPSPPALALRSTQTRQGPWPT